MHTTFRNGIWTRNKVISSGKTTLFIDFGFLERLWQATFAASTFKPRSL
jgi:hypothetical protein